MIMMILNTMKQETEKIYLVKVMKIITNPEVLKVLLMIIT